MTFKDRFGQQAGYYARFRPHYPGELFAYLAAQSPSHNQAWDCGTGNGQAALGLAEFFEQIIATDASHAQIAHAPAHPRIQYRVSKAEASELAASSIDLIVVAQALHWFAAQAFAQEVRRVLKPGGLLAAWGYSLCRIDPALDRILDHYYQDIVGPFWPAERRHLDDGYQHLSFPFSREPAPAFRMQAWWTLNELLGYLATWSAHQAYVKKHMTDPLTSIHEELRQAWGEPTHKRRVVWPLHLLVGRYRD